MPCDTVQTMAVALKVADLALLFKALDALKMRPVMYGNTIQFGNSESFNKDTQELRVTNEAKVARIKQAYSAEIVKSQARRYGWTLKETAPFQYVITKR